MRTLFALLATISLTLFSGCQESKGSMDPSAVIESDFTEGPTTSVPGSIGATATSLFKSDQAVLSNQDIEKILSAKVYAPAKARIAVVRIGGRYPWGKRWWSESVAQVEQQGSDRMLAAFRGSARVGSVVVLPTMLTPADTTIPFLRESAARVQADLLLIYRTFTQSYQQEKFFGGGDVHAYCTVEAILLDTRSGIIVDTSIKTRSFSAPKGAHDLEIEETVARNQQEAISEALGQASEELAKNLTAEPLPTAAAGPTTQVSGQ